MAKQPKSRIKQNGKLISKSSRIKANKMNGARTFSFYCAHDHVRYSLQNLFIYYDRFFQVSIENVGK